jgi:hypothetical protein
MWAPSIQFCYKILELVKGGNENQILIIDHDQRKKNEQYPNQLFPINGHGYHMKCYDKITTTLTKYTQIYIFFGLFQSLQSTSFVNNKLLQFSEIGVKSCSFLIQGKGLHDNTKLGK